MRPGTDDLIRTPRLELWTVGPSEVDLLARDRADPRLWRARGFSNPYGHLVDDPGPLPFRIPLVGADPAAAPFLLRMAVLRADRVVIGSAGFHARPDAEGMIEIGLGVVPEFRGRGLAQEILHGMWGWVVDQPGVRTLRYTVSPTNAPSLAIIRKCGFTHVGVQLDEVDGPEDVFEMSAVAYRERFATT